MKRIHFVVFFMVLAATAIAQTVPSQNNGTAPTQGAAGAVSILKPASGTKLQTDSVTVTYALTNPAASASGTPNFEVRLDSRDPVTTTSTDHTFTGLTPGPHTVTVQLVDANGTPVSGGKAVVNFTVVRTAAMLHGPQAIAAALRLNPSDIRIASASKPEPVSAAGTLPLISVIGFGVLLGGIASAMKSSR
ncbi:MAG: hypothetical protein ACRD3E_19965 [Terriglobales bacterium]